MSEHELLQMLLVELAVYLGARSLDGRTFPAIKYLEEMKLGLNKPYVYYSSRQIMRLVNAVANFGFYVILRQSQIFLPHDEYDIKVRISLPDVKHSGRSSDGNDYISFSRAYLVQCRPQRICTQLLLASVKMTSLSPILGIPGILLLSALFLGSIHVVYWSNYFNAKLFQSPPPNGTAFDFIVVGSGSAGSVVTARLAEAGYDVLLIEAGGPSHVLHGVPGIAPFFATTPYDWDYRMKATEGVGGAFNDGQIPQPRGKELGGSSMFNAMIYVRGHREDYNEWARLGNRGWSYDDVLPYFRKSERFTGDVTNKEKYHGTEGAMTVEHPRYSHPIDTIVRDTLKDLGLKAGDVNGDLQDGGIYDPGQQTTQDGYRLGTFKSFVAPILDKTNITVLAFTVANEVLVLSDRAYGVEVERFGQTYRYFAKNEVILSAGAIGSPQVLMLSGIGPRGHLKDLGINLVKDLPVGQNLQDHLLVMANLEIGDSAERLTAHPLQALIPANHFEYWTNGTGPLSNNNLGVNAIFHSSVNEDPSRPDLQFHVVPFNYGADFGLVATEVMNYNATVWKHVFEGRMDKGFSIFPSLLRPKSRGNITLASRYIHDAPIIDPQYLTHDDDIRLLVDGMKFLKHMESEERFKKHKITLFPPETLYCGSFEAWSDEYYECYVKNYISTIYHPVGTCTMGHYRNKEAVVDSRLKVHGIDGLRVIDASIMPRLVGGNTNAAAVMIGEKGADMIIEDWQIDEATGKRKGLKGHDVGSKSSETARKPKPSKKTGKKNKTEL